MRGPLDDSWQQEDRYSSLIIGWDSDAGRLGGTVIDYLNNKLNGQFFYDMEPGEFFPLNGIAVEDDLIQFPESRFYSCARNRIMMFKSTPPNYDWYNFFNQVLNIAEKSGQIKEVYVIGGMLSLITHTIPPQLICTFSSFEMKEELSAQHLDNDLNYESPPGQKPTLNSYFLWAARKRNLSGVSLWISIPFYLMSVDDPRAQKKMLEFFDRRFFLGLDLSEFDDVIMRQNQRLEEARRRFPDIDDYLLRLEGNMGLSEDENVRLVKQVEEYLKADIR